MEIQRSYQKILEKFQGIFEEILKNSQQKLGNLENYFRPGENIFQNYSKISSNFFIFEFYEKFRTINVIRENLRSHREI